LNGADDYPSLDIQLPEIVVTPPDYTWVWIVAGIALLLLFGQNGQNNEKLTKHHRKRARLAAESLK
jgi:hypothetical protein